tara:strand:- start:561 stop:1097 length:537 start_codon:yes stop_codon:yes gene_type:complete
MALWGNNDNVLVASSGIITCNGTSGAVVGSGTTFTNYSVGQTLTVGVGMTSGFGVITEITDDSNLTITTTSTEQATNIHQAAAGGFIVGDRPTSNVVDPEFAPTSSNAERDYTSKVYGVNEAILEARSGSQYEPAHAGWVGIQTYMDAHGNLRVKSEVLVAMSGISTNTQASGAVLPS